MPPEDRWRQSFATAHRAYAASRFCQRESPPDVATATDGTRRTRLSVAMSFAGHPERARPRIRRSCGHDDKQLRTRKTHRCVCVSRTKITSRERFCIQLQVQLDLAEGVGFEPTVLVRGRQFSRLVHSTALPPLRGTRIARASYCKARFRSSRSAFWQVAGDRAAPMRRGHDIGARSQAGAAPAGIRGSRPQSGWEP
jgi:hypothetical protein